MKDKTLLMIPGPTPVPENVLLAMAKSPVPHRSSEFSAIFDEVNESVISCNRKFWRTVG